MIESEHFNRGEIIKELVSPSPSFSHICKSIEQNILTLLPGAERVDGKEILLLGDWRHRCLESDPAFFLRTVSVPREVSSLCCQQTVFFKKKLVKT